jgi:hypothetical protein
MANRLLTSAEVAADLRDEMLEVAETLSEADKRKFYEAFVRYIEETNGFPAQLERDK